MQLSSRLGPPIKLKNTFFMTPDASRGQSDDTTSKMTLKSTIADPSFKSDSPSMRIASFGGA